MKSNFHATSAAFAKNGCGLKKNPFQSWRLYPDSAGAWRESSAFSLTEVVIAMGVAAVAFTSIIGLFPLGLNMSKESYESTQAALLARTIMADIKDQQTGNGNLRGTKPYQNKQLQIAGNSDPVKTKNNYTLVPLNSVTPVSAYIAYNQLPRSQSDTDPAGSVMLRPLTYSTNPTAPGWYNSGSNTFFAVVKLTISPSCRFGTAASTSTPMRIDVSVETPGNANISNRTCYLFTGVARP